MHDKAIEGETTSIIHWWWHVGYQELKPFQFAAQRLSNAVQTELHPECVLLQASVYLRSFRFHDPILSKFTTVVVGLGRLHGEIGASISVAMKDLTRSSGHLPSLPSTSKQCTRLGCLYLQRGSRPNAFPNQFEWCCVYECTSLFATTH